MSTTVEAIFENGVLKPVVPLDIPEHTKVKVTVEDECADSFDSLSLISMVYEGLSPKDIDDIESIILDRSRFSRNFD
ncbi:MAG: antitoxin family protein [Nitrospirae bacterium]|nr:antitoxin family protein [Nitrospirota bacterium]